MICEQKLKTLSDLTQPSNWYPKARETFRKIIFHAASTNSGKTYKASKRFHEAKGVITALRLLDSEVCENANEKGVKCDCGRREAICS